MGPESGEERYRNAMGAKFSMGDESASPGVPLIRVDHGGLWSRIGIVAGDGDSDTNK